MAERFLGLPLQDQAEVLRVEAERLGRRDSILEKDVWVCWVLDKLFSISEMPRMAFKGGTSLSKVYGAIHRFSEDVDVTFDYRDLRVGLGFDQDPRRMSGERLKKFREALQASVKRLVEERVAPHLYTALRREIGRTAQPLEVSGSGEQVKLLYPSACQGEGYLKECVLLEFGGRNLTEPCGRHRIKPDIAAHLPALRFPAARVTVLSPQRTFWEKATLIHAECSRGSLRATADRPSRHWYDLAILADHEIGRGALADRVLLAAVVEHKEWSFRDPRARYRDCLAGRLKLLPETAAMGATLREDYSAMIRAGMFDAPPPSFEKIETRLGHLAEQVNSSSRSG